ncbi:metallopeptidase TldD-related protein [Micromonospora auratinigra]|uniref:Predicted Zn-dependent protease or its inactivated homolog n=1 Tax=Micromonospora auratinigra TaxID=261654 RepID=A0A1A8ZG45_9ACTN|nr:metallopeptidase TldD-related protein [Micromonospora auratinigra]SBT42984.1 Predicted Zn-dependent protease or its inactivated homolog [Micromonospora auratinigra]
MNGAELAERALAHAGPDELLVLVDETSTAHLRWADNALTTSGTTRHRRLTVVALAAGTAGTAAAVLGQGGAPDDREVAALVARARATARSGPPAPDAAPLLTPAADPAPSWGESAADVPVDRLRGVASGLGDAFARARATGHALHGYAEQQAATTWLAGTTGLRLRHVQPTSVLDLTARDAAGTASTWAGVGGTDLTGTDLPGLAAGLADRLDAVPRRRALAPGRYEVLLPPACVADLMLHLYLNAGAADAADGRTVFSAPDGGTRIGDRLTEAPLTLRSDPAAPGLACAPFVTARASGSAASVFDNGLPLAATRWLVDGELRALVQTRHSAGLTGQPLTPQIDNLTLTGPPGGRSLAEMIAGTGRGLLLTCLWYLRDVDPRTLLLTGLTRDGVYLVEDGEVVAALPNFRFNESPVALLDRVVEIGATERTLPREWGDYFTRMAMPTLRVADFGVSEVSPAV